MYRSLFDYSSVFRVFLQNNAREGDENRPNDPDEDNPNNELNQNHPTQQENHPGTQSVFAVMYTFVSSFFTSLLPQNVQ